MKNIFSLFAHRYPTIASFLWEYILWATQLFIVFKMEDFSCQFKSDVVWIRRNLSQMRDKWCFMRKNRNIEPYKIEDGKICVTTSFVFQYFLKLIRKLKFLFHHSLFFKKNAMSISYKNVIYISENRLILIISWFYITVVANSFSNEVRI